MKWIFPPALAILAVLAFGCDIPFLATGPIPSGPPPVSEKTAQQERPPEKRKEEPAPQTIACDGKDCPQTTVAAKTVEKPNLTPSQRPRGESSGIGPRLARLLARDELEKLAAAHLVVDMPERMIAGSQARVDARLTEELRPEFVKNLLELGLSNAEQIASASSFRAQLSGHGFEIAATPDEERSIAPDKTAWSWHVAPIETGVRSLVLTLTARVAIPGGGEEEREMPPIMRKITIESSTSPSSSATLERGWLWLGAVFFVVATVAGVIARKRQSV
jgi:hypothetical protein